LEPLNESPEWLRSVILSVLVLGRVITDADEHFTRLTVVLVEIAHKSILKTLFAVLRSPAHQVIDNITIMPMKKRSHGVALPQL
jgi:hypothetical protein